MLKKGNLIVENPQPSTPNTNLNCLLASLFIISAIVLMVAVVAMLQAQNDDMDWSIQTVEAQTRYFDETSTAIPQQNLGTQVSVYMTRTSEAEVAITETAIQQMGMIPQQFTATAIIWGATQTGAAELGTFEPTSTPNVLQQTATAIIGETATVGATFGTSTSTPVPTLLEQQLTATAIIRGATETAAVFYTPNAPTTLSPDQHTATAIISGATATAFAAGNQN